MLKVLPYIVIGSGVGLLSYFYKKDNNFNFNFKLCKKDYLLIGGIIGNLVSGINFKRIIRAEKVFEIFANLEQRFAGISFGVFIAIILIKCFQFIKKCKNDNNNDNNNDDVLRYFYPHAGYHEVATPFYSRLYQFQKSKKIKQKGIATFAFKSSKHFREIPKDVNMKFVNFPLPGTMDILRDKLLIISWNNTATGILIISEEIAEHFKNYFDKIWDIAEN